jgi:hypothetical protein
MKLVAAAERQLLKRLFGRCLHQFSWPHSGERRMAAVGSRSKMVSKINADVSPRNGNIPVHISSESEHRCPR